MEIAQVREKLSPAYWELYALNQAIKNNQWSISVPKRDRALIDKISGRIDKLTNDVHEILDECAKDGI